MKTTLFVLLLLLLGVPAPADSRLTAEETRIRSLRLAVEMHYKFRHKAPRSWDDLQGDFVVWRAEDAELLRRQFLFVGVKGHDTRHPDNPPRELLLISVYPKRLKTRGAPLEEWHVVRKSSIISGDWIPAKDLQHFSGWAEVQEKIKARRAELASAPAGVAPPVKSTFTDEVYPPRGQTVSLAAQQAAKQSRPTSKSGGAPAERASRGAHPALFAALGIGALLIALLVGRRMFWRRAAGRH